MPVSQSRLIYFSHFVYTLYMRITVSRLFWGTEVSAIRAGEQVSNCFVVVCCKVA